MSKAYDFGEVKPGVELVEVRRPKFGYKDGVPVRFRRKGWFGNCKQLAIGMYIHPHEVLCANFVRMI